MSVDIVASLERRHHQYARGCVKTSEDLARYEHVIAVVGPSLIVEAGTFSGKAALWFAQHAPVLTCDPAPQIDPSTAAVLAHQPHPIRVVEDTSLSPAMQQALADEMHANPGPLLLSLDGDHSAATVLAELEAYAPLAAYVVVEDTLLRWMPAEERVYDGDPHDAVDRFLGEQGDVWEIDVDVEALSTTTQFPSGWLRRRH